jgi:undecaprenyl-diphosphatase
MEIKDLIKAPSFDGRLIVMGLIGSVVSGLVGYGAIIWLVRIVKSRRLDLFTWYLVALGAVVLVWSLKTG